MVRPTSKLVSLAAMLPSSTREHHGKKPNYISSVSDSPVESVDEASESSETSSVSVT